MITKVITRVRRKVTEFYIPLVRAPKNPIEGLPDSKWEEMRYVIDYLVVSSPE